MSFILKKHISDDVIRENRLCTSGTLMRLNHSGDFELNVIVYKKKDTGLDAL